MPRPPLQALVISDGRRGIQNQALGLTEALAHLRPCALNIHEVKRARLFSALHPLWQYRLRKQSAHYGIMQKADIAIGCGRAAIAPLLALKRARADIFTVYIQDPKINPARFDLVIAPEHDGLSAPNCLSMIGAPHRITPKVLKDARAPFSELTEKLPAPRAGLLIGGNSKRHKLTQAMCEAHIYAAQNLLTQGYSLVVTTSRRTPKPAIARWRALTEQHENIWFYNPEDAPDMANPYFAFLELSDILLVTQESTNMLTEAASTGKPLFTLPMEGANGKFEALYKSLSKRVNMRAFDNNPAAEPYEPLNETERIARQIWEKFEAIRA